MQRILVALDALPVVAFFSSSVFLFFYRLARGYAPHEGYQACQAKRRAAIDNRLMASRANSRALGRWWMAKLDPPTSSRIKAATLSH
jgi:hypothetical protein